MALFKDILQPDMGYFRDDRQKQKEFTTVNGSMKVTTITVQNIFTYMITVMVSQPQVRAGWGTESNRIINPHTVFSLQHITPKISTGTVPAIPLTGRGVARCVTVAVPEP